MLRGTAEEECRNLLTLSFFCFLIPPSLRATSPIAHTCAEEEVNAFLLNCLCSCFDFGATSRDAVGKKCKIYLSTPNGEYPLTPSPIPCGIVGHSHTPPLCFATQNIGEVARSAGGVEKIPAAVVIGLSLFSLGVSVRKYRRSVRKNLLTTSLHCF